MSTNNSNTIDLRNLFQNLQKQMLSKFQTIDDGIQHPGTKGEASERNWINMLSPYLPKRYKADNAFVIDSKGNISEQIDIVIYDEHFSPSLFNQDETKYIPAESVYAIFEVKQDLTKENMEYAVKKIMSVRNLFRTSTDIIDKGGVHHPRTLFNILGGILTHESRWSPPLGTSFDDVIKCLGKEKRLELGCVLKSGSFRCEYLDTGDITIEKSESEDSLMFFFLTLLYKLQQFGTVSAIDFKEYEKVLKK